MGVGNICGGLNPNSLRADNHAIRYYDSIRKRKSDCINIAKNTGLTLEQVSLVKSHIFYTYHNLDSGFRQFYPSYEMAESWRRLSGKDARLIQSHDLTLLRHELLEISFIWKGCSQKEAHTQASIVYNYQVESNAFYARMGFPVW